jgi:nucleoside-diphosphate-sugar epimerase
MILITGATGLVGSYLALQLAEKGFSIKAIHPENDPIQKTKDLFDLYNKGHLFSRISWVCADITDIPSLEIAFENVAYVYHCAGKISFNPSDEKILRKINIEGTANIVNFCLAKNVKKLCFVSSIEALGDVTHNHPEELENNTSKIINEETEWNPERANSDYAISKYGAEMEVWRGQQEGLEVIIVNPGVVLGPIPKTWNRNEGSFRMITKVANGLKHYTQGSTGFVGVSDVTSCMIQLMESDVKGQRYILVSENLTYKEITTFIANALQVSPPKKEVKKWMSEWICKINWIKSNVFFQKRTFVKANVLWLHSTDVYSNEKIKSQLSFHFQPIASVIKEIATKY